MKRSWKWAGFAGGIGALCAAFVSGQSWAGGIPATGALAYSGRLEGPGGEALTGTHNIEVKFWNVASAGTQVCTTNSQSLALDQGRFTVTLPDTCTDAVNGNPDIWVEVLVDGSSLGRVKAGAVPYAVEASHAASADRAASADSLGTLAPGALQQRLTSQCSGTNQSIKSIAPDGTVACETDDSPTYTGSEGITVSGTTIGVNESILQTRVDGVCNGNNRFIKTILADGGVTCDVAQTYLAGPALSASVNAGLNQTTFSIKAPTLVTQSVTGSSSATARFCALATTGPNLTCTTSHTGDTWLLNNGSVSGTCRWFCLPL